MLVRASSECFVGNGFREKGSVFDYASPVAEGEVDPDLVVKQGDSRPLLVPLTPAEVAAYWAAKEDTAFQGTQPPDIGFSTPRPNPAMRPALPPAGESPVDNGADMLS